PRAVTDAGGRDAEQLAEGVAWHTGIIRRHPGNAPVDGRRDEGASLRNNACRPGLEGIAATVSQPTTADAWVRQGRIWPESSVNSSEGFALNGCKRVTPINGLLGLSTLRPIVPRGPHRPLGPGLLSAGRRCSHEHEAPIGERTPIEQ